MAGCKLYYFNAKGRAELTRYAYAFKDVSYEDIRFDDNNLKLEDFKPRTPFGSAPALEVNGVVYAQSMAIARYVAREVGLMGANSLETLKIDMILDALSSDIFPFLRDVFMGETDEIKAAAKTKAVEAIHKIFAKLEALVSGDYFLGSEVSLADLAVFNFVNDFLPALGTNVDDLSKITNIVSSLKANENIKKHLENRPKTDM